MQPPGTVVREGTIFHHFREAPALHREAAEQLDLGRGVAMGLRDKYSQAVVTAKSVRMDGSAEERDGKLYFNGTVNSEDEKNQIWNALKTVPDWQKEIV